MMNKRTKRKLSIILRDPDEIAHRKGIIYFLLISIGVNCMAIHN